MSTEFTYSPWRHGGWYVSEVRYPSGACGCVSRNYSDRKWRIACDPRPFEEQPTFKTRDEAAQAEMDLVAAMYVYVRDLPKTADGSFLYCEECLGEFSATPGDYFAIGR